jgi:hypothetical protein
MRILENKRVIKTIDEIEGLKDGEIVLYGVNHLIEKRKNEKELVDYVVENIELFARDVLADEVIAFETDMPIEKQITLSPRGRRIDLYIKGKNKEYIIEFKNPNSGTENRAAIGQILDYGREFAGRRVELVIVTSNFDINTAKTIKYYNLPIRYIYLSSKYSLEYRGDADGKQSEFDTRAT